MTTCGGCDWFRQCRTHSCFVTPDQEKCQFPRPDGTAAWKARKLRGSERRKAGGKRA